jgi:hypothetical protein
MAKLLVLFLLQGTHGHFLCDQSLCDRNNIKQVARIKKAAHMGRRTRRQNRTSLTDSSLDQTAEICQHRPTLIFSPAEIDRVGRG